MKTLACRTWLPSLIAMTLTAALTLPAMAHPGHHHHASDDGSVLETLRSNYLHLHGLWEISLVVVAIAAVAVFRFAKKRSVRIGAALTFGGSLALFALR